VPELIEIEVYRRLAEHALHRKIAAVDAPDAWFLKGGVDAAALSDALVGEEFTDARRIGKLLLLDCDRVTLGLRFGMTGRLIVDTDVGVEDLQYASRRYEPAWDRFAVTFVDGGGMRINDARRLGGVLLDPDESRLGADAATITRAQLGAALAGSDAPLKARLMDQERVAGLGNLLTDEVLWRAGLDPARPAGSLDAAELRRLHHHVRKVVADLTAKGGSHTGRLMVAREPGGCCPKDGAELQRRTIGGRTTYSCPVHQR
jgi:formamidopyrimidine-DNA glycosylase